MRLSIRHLTVYEYAEPVAGATQVLRLTPREDSRQRVLAWRIAAPAPARAWIDAHGNRATTVTVPRPTGRIEIAAEGEVETQPGCTGAPSTVPAAVYLRATPLTTADERVRELASSCGARAEPERLMAAVRGALAYVAGTSTVETTAAQALARGAGVCQDHAHLFVACCRAGGIPARYVSGYLHARGGIATHAWAEALTSAGWLALDPANGVRVGEEHVALAYGLDYADAAPIRGSRRGGGDERMAAEVAVAQAQQ